MNMLFNLIVNKEHKVSRQIRNLQNFKYILNQKNKKINKKQKEKFKLKQNTKEMSKYTREELIYLAKISEQTERFKDMLEYMKQVVNFEQELSVEERRLLSIAINYVLDADLRITNRVLSYIEQKEESNGSKHINLIKDYKKKLQDQICNFCYDSLELLDILISKSSTEAKVYFLTKKGNQYRYIVECQPCNTQAYDEATNFSLQTYRQAYDIAIKELNPTNHTRLSLALQLSVFYYEIMNDPTKACNLAKQAFNDAFADIEHIEEDQYRVATSIMQLLRDNITLWTAYENGEDDGVQVENI
ncbi:14-3-3 family protein 14-3-3 beta/zeta (macronuclear) [Tetrahymena thermophila SB210]|uniref:14-3-3 family protein 14-3-3 beta/zeta n=1 Tax=Tetrahymena thermophila (strain SB210) TaxID=312017 RepID=Q22W56_TETTS|nr:14-3-3 family protein 14-3-3 beta/zeta [Tetrahymena thermophila SB210]EAR89561.2 14-3-3 family protein 14-3-3 beta/zeta [Tetrahymena thermophila SB210]|eukprot:XP_001009806.2 14-3-3 family protein 14-3-3 beta/zeta [Tetrahymena thermophila SB210]